MAGNVMGVQDGFNWKSVGLSALSGGIATGLGTTALAGSAGWQDTALRMAAANTLTQGVGVITGLQRSFDWRGVAASAAGAAAGHTAGQALGRAVSSTDWSPFAKELVTRTGAGLAAGTMASLAQGGRVSMQQVATDAFGNALGNSLASASSGQRSDNVPEPVGAAERTEILGYFADGPGDGALRVNGLTFADDMVMRQRANDPRGLRAVASDSASVMQRAQALWGPLRRQAAAI